MKLLKHKALSDWSWVSCPKAKFSPSEIMNLTPFTVSDHLGGFIGELKDKVRTFRALASLPSQYTRFLLYFINSMVCLCVIDWKPEMHPVQSECWAQLCGSVVPCNDWGQPRKGSLLGDYIDLPMPGDTQCPCEGSGQKWAKVVDWTFLSWSPFPSLFGHFITAWGVRAANLTGQIVDFQGTCDPWYSCVLLLRPQTWNCHEAPRLTTHRN